MNSAITSIPQVSYRLWTSGTPDDKANFSHILGEAFKNFGFLTLSHTGLDPQHLAQTYAHCRRFFTQPLAWKTQYIQPHSLGQAGYVHFGKETAKHAPTYDLKEFWHVDRALTIKAAPAASGRHQKADPSPWPRDHPEFGASLSKLYSTLEVIGHHLLRAASQYLKLEPPYLLHELCHQGPTLLRAAYYPALDPTAHPAAVRAAPHEDINFITLLCASTADGLEIKLPHGPWLPLTIPPDAGTIIVSSGDMLQHITGGLFRSTTHQVVNSNHCRKDRLALPFFVHPHPSTILKPIPSCQRQSSDPTSYPTITAGEFLHQRLTTINLASASTQPRPML